MKDAPNPAPLAAAGGRLRDVFGRFLIGGGASTAFYVSLGAGLDALWPAEALLAHSLAFALGVAVSYAIHRRFTFRYAGGHKRAAPRFAATALFAYLASSLAIAAAESAFDPHSLVLFMGSATIIVVTNFVAMLLWVFVDR